jgi:hypothetical protein
MKFFFDDSGDFSLPQDSKDKVSLWMGILIPETCEKAVERKFLEWEDIVKKNNPVSREIKGTDLSSSSRDLLFGLLSNEADLLVHPTIIDLQIQRTYSTKGLNKLLKDLSIERSENLTSSDMRERVKLHGRRIGNLSDEQVMKFFALIHCIIETLRHAVIFRSDGNFRECWNSVQFWVDKSSKRPSNREEAVFWESFGWNLHNYTKRNPIELLDWIHDNEHPFVKNYERAEQIDGRSLFKDIYFEDSSANWGLRLADVFANTMIRVLGDLDNTKRMLRFYKKIMKHSPLGPNSNLGFIVIVDSQDLDKNVPAKKYAILQQILASRK